MPALTGLRFFLALWVILHHLTGPGRVPGCHDLLRAQRVRADAQLLEEFVVSRGIGEVLPRTRGARLSGVRTESLGRCAVHRCGYDAWQVGLSGGTYHADTGVAWPDPRAVEHSGVVAFLRDVLLRCVSAVGRVSGPAHTLAVDRGGGRSRLRVDAGDVGSRNPR